MELVSIDNNDFGEEGFLYEYEDVEKIRNVLKLAKQAGFRKYLKKDTCYTAEMFGDLDHDILMISRDAPPKFKTWLLLQIA